MQPQKDKAKKNVLEESQCKNMVRPEEDRLVKWSEGG